MRRVRHLGMQKLKEPFISGSASSRSWPCSVAWHSTLVALWPHPPPLNPHSSAPYTNMANTFFLHHLCKCLLTLCLWLRAPFPPPLLGKHPITLQDFRQMSCRCPPAADHLDPPVVKQGGFATHLEKEITPTVDRGCEKRVPARTYYIGFKLRWVIGRRA